MSETLEEKARRIGDDVAAIWHKVQEKGGMVPHNLNTENLVDILNQVYSVSKWNAKGAFFYTPNGFYDFYTTHEINRMSELPAAPDGYTWRLSLEDVKSILENNNYAIIASDGAFPFDTRLHMEMDNASHLTVELLIEISGHSDDVRIIWGDGNITQPTTTARTLYTHTYASTGNYELSFEVEGDTAITIYQHRTGQGTHYTNVGTNMFGDTGANSSSQKEGLYIFNCLTSAILGPKTKFYNGAFSPGVSNYNWSYLNSSNLTNIFYSYDPELIESIAGSSMTTYAMPNSATGFNTALGMYISGCNKSSITSFTPSPNFTVIPEYCFRDTQLTTFDFSNIDVIRAGAFCNVPLTGVVDLSNVTSFPSTNVSTEGIITDNNTTTKIILNHEVEIPEDNLIGNRYSNNPQIASFHNLTSLEEINIPTNWIILPSRFLHYTNVDVSALTFPHNLEYLSAGCLTTNRYSQLANIINALPGTVTNLTGLGLISKTNPLRVDDMTGVTYPASLAEIGESAFMNRVLENFVLPANLRIKNHSFYLTYIRGTFTIDSSWTVENNAFNYLYAENLVIDNNGAVSNGMFNQARSTLITFGQNFTATNLNCAFRNIAGQYVDSTPESHGTKIIVPSTVTTLNANEFGGGMSTIVFEGQVPSIQNGSFVGNNRFGTVIDMTNCTFVPSTTTSGFGTLGSAQYIEVIVPDALYASWIADTNWDYIITNYHLNVIKESEA